MQEDILANILNRFNAVEEQLNAPLESIEEQIKLQKQFNNLLPIATLIREKNHVEVRIKEAEELINSQDLDLKSLAYDEMGSLSLAKDDIEQKLQSLLNKQQSCSTTSIIVEIRAATGGEEAALFALDLFRMYQRYAEYKSWEVEIMDSSSSDNGGLKEITMSIAGIDCMKFMQYESGVHRVQRVPVTESQGRVHTSTATVAVLLEPEEVTLNIETKDLRIDVYRASGAGGQHVNKTDSAVRITHLPTGLIVQQQDDKSQHKNKAKAMRILKARLLEREQMLLHTERAQVRQGQIGAGTRSEKIRTYNFHDNRVTDHRIKVTLHKLDRVLLGPALDELTLQLVAYFSSNALTTQLQQLVTE